jgi:hypothetical protein
MLGFAKLTPTYGLLFMKQNIASVALALLPALVHAKCAEQTYVLEGRVADVAGRPAAGALVGASWLEAGQPAGPAIAVVDKDGRYRLAIRYRPMNDLAWFNACSERLARINLVAYAGDLRSYPTPVTVTGLDQRLPDIRISEPAASPQPRRQ